MKDNPIYIQTKKDIIDAGLTAKQIESMSEQDLASASGYDYASESNGFWINLKQNLVHEKRQAEAEVNLNGLKTQLIGGNRQWLKAGFPNVEFEINDRIITIYLDGKPGQLLPPPLRRGE